jgi:hypothetical protein
MNLTNKHIILTILTIIIFAFIYSYDVYIVEKNQPICKPIYITKKILSPEAELLLMENGVSSTNEKQERQEHQENLTMLSDDIIEGFNTIMGMGNNDNLTIPGSSLSSFTVSGVIDKQKIKVMDSVIKVLSNIPTNIDVNLIKQMIEYFGMIYQTSSSLANFYQNVSVSTKIKEAPYNSKYSQLILYLIGKFNNDVEDCIEKPNNECGLVSNNTSKTDNDIIPKYLQTEFNDIKKITSEIVNSVSQEVSNDLAQEIKLLYPKIINNNQENNNNNTYQEHFNNDNPNVISSLIKKITPFNNNKCVSCSSNNSYNTEQENDYNPISRPLNPEYQEYSPYFQEHFNIPFDEKKPYINKKKQDCYHKCSAQCPKK